MRIFATLQKNLVLALAFIMALSSFGGGAALAWVHNDGSLCYVCPLEEPGSTSAVSCCAPVEPVVSATDCQICCEAQSQQQAQRKVLPASFAVLPEFPTLAQLFRLQAGPLSTQRSLARKTAPHSLPSLRAPPA